MQEWDHARFSSESRSKRERENTTQRCSQQLTHAAEVFACMCCCLQEEARAKVEEQKKRAEEARAAAAEAAKRKQVRRKLAKVVVAAQTTIAQKIRCNMLVLEHLKSIYCPPWPNERPLL
jgi:hypothetical protein